MRISIDEEVTRQPTEKLPRANEMTAEEIVGYLKSGQLNIDAAKIASKKCAHLFPKV